MEDYLVSKKTELDALKQTMVYAVVGAAISFITCLIFYFGIPTDGTIVYLCFVIMAVCSTVHISRYIAHKAVYQYAKDQYDLGLINKQQTEQVAAPDGE